VQALRFALGASHAGTTLQLASDAYTENQARPRNVSKEFILVGARIPVNFLQARASLVSSSKSRPFFA
jgi:hypothetical protein